jgi:hypothetical protein
MFVGLASFFRPNQNLDRSVTFKDLLIFLTFILSIIAFTYIAKLLPNFEEIFKKLIHSPFLIITSWILSIFVSIRIFKESAEQGAAANP